MTIPNPGGNNAGVKVPENASLVIYGQTAGTGVLTVTGGLGGAGIGGGMGCAGGAVTINGGTVTATGGQYGAVTGASFTLGTGLCGVRVIFTPEYGYRFVDKSEIGVRELDSPAKSDCSVEAPEVEVAMCEVTFAVGDGVRRAASVCGGVTNELVTGETALAVRLGTSVELIVEELPLHYPFACERTFTVEQETMRVEIFARPIPKGMEGNPFQIGADVFAMTTAAGVLTITGTGAMRDFANAADVPWDSDAVTRVVVDDGVVRLGANAFAALDDTVTVNGMTLAMSRFVASALGPASTAPSGAISGTEFERVDIVDGKAYLGVSVCTNGDVTATTEGWGAAKLDPLAVEQAADGKGLVIPVPATAEKGFMILKSKGK